MSESKRPVTGYQVCQDMVRVLQAEVEYLRGEQLRRQRGTGMSGPARALADACSKLQGEIRKTGEQADKAVNNLPPERQVELMLKMISELSPEFRMVIRIHLEELGAAIL